MSWVKKTGYTQDFGPKVSVGFVALFALIFFRFFMMSLCVSHVGIRQKQTFNPCHLKAFGASVNQSNNLWLSGLGSIPESEGSERSMSCQHHLPSRPADFRQVQPGSALADALGEFLLPPDPPGMESLYEEDRVSLHDVSMFDRCSSASSDSSIDIAFVKCPKAPPASHHAMAVNVSTARDVFGNGGSHGNGYKLLNRGCVSPDEAVMMRRNQHRPLQASQRKSKVSLFVL